jgi:hypothetical protein
MLKAAEASVADNDPLAKARRVLSDAVRLCHLCALHWRDENDIGSSGTEIVYAVDVDVVMMHSAPREKAHDAQTFGDASAVNESVAALIGHFVVSALDGSPSASTTGVPVQPLLMLPTHAAELRRVALAIAEKATDTVDDKTLREIEAIRAKREEWQRELGRLDEPVVVERLLNLLERDAPTLRDLLIGDVGPQAELRRMGQIPRGRLVPWERHPAFQHPAQEPPSDRWLDEVADEWVKRMAVDVAKLSPARLNLIYDDARALAMLQWLNSECTRLAVNRRVVLVTATQRLIDAGSCDDACSMHQGFATFGEAYLRDARSLLGAKTFFVDHAARTGDTQFRVQEWMGLLFPKAVRQRRAEPSAGLHVRSVVELSLTSLDHALDEQSVEEALRVLTTIGYGANARLAFPDSALEEWQDVVRGTYSSRLLSQDQNARQQLLRWLGTSGEADERLDRLLGSLAYAVQQSLSDLYWSTGVIGVEQLPGQNQRIRGLPALRFDTAPNTTAIDRYRALVRSLFSKDRTSRVDMRPLYEELAREDGSTYRAHVLHAFVYASAGRWFTTRTLCRTALVIAEPLGAAPAVRRGREAAYLLAVAERRLAIDEAGISFARKALQQARDRCDTLAERDDPRFASEQLAQDVGLLQLRYFGHGVRPQGSAAPELMERALVLAYGAARRTTEEPSVRRWIVRQSVTNGLVVGLVAADAGLRQPQVTGHARKLIELLAQEGLAPALDGAPQLYADEISDFVWLVAVAQFESAWPANIARERLQTSCPQPPSESPMHTERARHVRFCRLVGLDA